MKIFKIVLGFLLLFAAGGEYVDASFQLGSFFEWGIIIVCLLIIILSSWLIGSGFSVKKFQLKSFEFVKYLSISLVTFALAVVFGLASNKAPSHFANINGLRVPLGKCIDGNRKVIPDEKERIAYCECLFEKITSDPELKSKYQKKLENDEFNIIAKDIKTNPTIVQTMIPDCMSTMKLTWTNSIVNSMKQSWKQELMETEFAETNDVDIYCDCLIEEYQKFPLDHVMNDEFSESDEAFEIEERCTKKSAK